MKRFISISVITLVLFGLTLFLPQTVIPRILDKADKEIRDIGLVGKNIQKADNLDAVAKLPCGLNGNRIIICQSGYYYFQMRWYNAVAMTEIYLDSPQNQYIATYSGYYPPVGGQISLGYFSKDDELIIRIRSFWHESWYGPEYSTDSDFFIISEIPGGWTFRFEDAVNYDHGYNDGEFDIFDES